MSLTGQQVETLLRPIHGSRVLHAQNQSHVAQHDIRAHLIRMFGFGNFDVEVKALDCIRDATGENGRPEVTYRAVVRLTVRDPQGHHLCTYEDVGTGSSPNLPKYGDAHDFACKNAVSYAVKRCAVNLGDQFGLSLYNKGQTDPFVRGTLVGLDETPNPERDDVAGTPVNSMGEDDANSAAPQPKRPAPITVVPDRPAPVTDVPLPPDATTAQSLVTELYAHRTVPRELTKIMARVSALRLQTTEVADEHAELVPLGELCNRLLNAATGRSA